MKKEIRQVIAVRLKPSLIKKLKARAKKLGITLTKLFEQRLER